MSSNVEQIFDFVAREATPSDLGYVLSTWERSLRDEYRDADNRDFAAAIRATLERELHAGGSLVIAEPTPGFIWGWCLVNAGVVIYVYVRHKYRSVRVASRLLAAAGIDLEQDIPVACMTADARRIKWTGNKKLRYLPRL